MWFWWRGSTCTQVRIIPEGICWSRGAIVTMKGFSAFLDKRWCKNWPHKKTAPENIYLKTCPASFSKSTECLISALYPNSFQRLLKISSYTSIWFNPCRGRWQLVVDIISLSFLIFKSFPSHVIQELTCIWPWLQTLNCNSVLLIHVCWRNIWKSTCLRSFQWFPQGPEKTPNSSRAGEQTSVIASFEPIVA